jgi:hypothetical protein
MNINIVFILYMTESDQTPWKYLEVLQTAMIILVHTDLPPSVLRTHPQEDERALFINTHCFLLRKEKTADHAKKKSKIS